MKTALVLGAGGFIGSHMVKRLKSEGYWVRGVDLKYPEFSPSFADEFIVGDLRQVDFVKRVIVFDGVGRNFYNTVAEEYRQPFDEIYQFAADMGGAGFVFTGDNDADIMHNSATINLNVLDCLKNYNEFKNLNKTKIFYSGSACMYPEHNQLDPDNPNCEESSAYPANPDSEYGWEKLFSERLYMAFHRNHGLECRIARFHNIYGVEGTWQGGREKAPAALCRKVAMTPDGGTIDMFGDGKQTRSFLYVDECVEGILRLMRSDYWKPVNIGSEEMISINDFATMIADVAGKTININHIPGPLGVRGRSSDNRLIRQVLGWEPNAPLREGITKTYEWIAQQLEK